MSRFEERTHKWDNKKESKQFWRLHLSFPSISKAAKQNYVIKRDPAEMFYLSFQGVLNNLLSMDFK